LLTEITTPELYAGLRGVAFVDAGWLGNNNPNVNKLSSDSMASAGLGLRYAISSIVVSADYGRVVAGSTLPAATGALVPRSGDDKLHVNLTARF
jgi:hemolysin activation/secretion protein